jgi:hypothetical protein
VNAKPTPTTLPPPRPLEAHGPKPGLHLARGPGAMPDHRWAALESVAVRLLCSKHGQFCLSRLRQASLGSPA